MLEYEIAVEFLADSKREFGEEEEEEEKTVKKARARRKNDRGVCTEV